MSAPVKQVCRTCKGENVQADAYARWNVETQEWEVSNVFDKGAYCDDCDGETRIEEEEIANGHPNRSTRCHCGGAVVFSRECAAKVCDECGNHLGLARCYCGWARDGGDGRAQLVEMGETIGDDEAGWG